MLKSYKYLIILLILSAYTIGVSWITNGIVERHYLKQEIIYQNKTIQTIADNKKLADTLDKRFLDLQAQLREDNKALNQKVEDELKNDPRYASCRTTDGMLDAYRKKRQLQQPSR